MYCDQKKTFNQSPSAICELPPDGGPCRDGQFNRWHFDYSTRTCVMFRYGGCGGNFNRFKTFNACTQFCQAAMQPSDPWSESETSSVHRIVVMCLSPIFIHHIMYVRRSQHRSPCFPSSSFTAQETVSLTITLQVICLCLNHRSKSCALIVNQVLC